MISSIILFISTYTILSVHAFFYHALPLVVVKNDNTYRAFCPWNDSLDPDLACKVNKNVMGYYHRDKTPEPHQFLNPLVQRLFTRDHCDDLKQRYGTESSNPGMCKNYGVCFNLSDSSSMCTCQAGFFGSAYVGCKKHCFSNYDCVNPVSYCHKPGRQRLPFCACKSGYQGDGVMCYRNPCGDNRQAKCGPNKVCVPTGPGENDYRCMCPDGEFLDYDDKCVPEVKLLTNSVLTLSGKHVQNGSRLELGECLTIVLNDGSKSIFYHKNSGDSIYVKRGIKNDNHFSLFFILTDELTAFSAVEGTRLGLTKLYSISNTFKNCKFGTVNVIRPNGEEVVVGKGSREKMEVHLRMLSKEEVEGGLISNVKLPEKVLEGEFTDAEVRPRSSLEL